jgi:Domain of unknown function (DUF6268)
MLPRFNCFPLSILAWLAIARAPVGAAGEAVSWDSEVNVSGVANSDFKGPSKIGNVDAFDISLSAVASVPAKPGLLVRLGVEWQRHDFGMPDVSPLPSLLQSANLVIGADWQLGDAWLMRLDIRPGLFGSDDGIRGRDFNVPLTVGGSYIVSPDLQLVAGLSVNPNRKYPVLGAVGVRWRLNRSWVLDAILPAPRLEYSFTDALTLYVGGEFRDETYRVAGQSDRTQRFRKLNNAVVDYTQIRVGMGMSWKLRSPLTLGWEAGVVPVHEFDFHRADIRYRSTGSPFYTAISFKAEF